MTEDLMLLAKQSAAGSARDQQQCNDWDISHTVTWVIKVTSVKLAEVRNQLSQQDLQGPFTTNCSRGIWADTACAHLELSVATSVADIDKNAGYHETTL